MPSRHKLHPLGATAVDNHAATWNALPPRVGPSPVERDMASTQRVLAGANQEGRPQ